jgi:light-regulated signal transduction histidine kinase (bacteriophytochrome)
MGELVDDLLAFSRVGRKQMEKEPVDMEALVRGVLADLPPRNSDTRGTVTVHALPPAFGDPALLRQVWTNLLSNALKFSARTPHPRIDVAGRIEGGDVVYTVSDNGIGFDMQYAHKLFGVFERLHPAEDFEGTGVGLALVQRIVQRHGGRAWAQGAVNRGATFSFTLPAV